MELVERQGLLEGLERFAAEARGGEGRAILVGGEAGVGKTTLVRAFVVRGSQPRRVFWGTCDPLVTPEPLAPFRDARQLRGVLAANAERVDLLEALLDELAGTPPTVMVLDDVHWADEATVDAIRYLGRRVHTTTGMLIATFREEEAGAAPGFRAVLGDLATAPGTRRLRVPPLTPAGVARLAAGIPIEATRLYAATGGNPFYVTEVLAAPGWTVPATVSDAVLARVTRLHPEARTLLETISLSPGGLEPWIAVEVSGAPPEVVDEATEVGMVVVAGDRLAFRHELARLAVEAAVPKSRSRRLHAQVLAHLEAASQIDPARATHHAAAAGDAGAVLRHAPPAAREASSRGAHRAAAEHLARAVDAAEAIAPDRLGPLVAALADERELFADPVDALALRQRSLDIQQRDGDRLAEAYELLHMTRLMDAVANDAGAWSFLERAVTLLESVEPGPMLASAYAMVGFGEYLALRFDEALARADTAMRLGRATGGRRAIELALKIRGSIRNLTGTGVEGLDDVHEVAALAESAGDHESLMENATDAASDLVRARRYDDARLWLARAVEIGRSADLDRRLASSDAILAVAAFEQARWGEADAILARLSAVATGVGFVDFETHGTRGRLGVRRGTPGSAALLDAAWMQIADAAPPRQWDVAIGRAEAAWLAGRPQVIPEMIGGLFRVTHAAGVRWPAGELAFWLWRAGALAVPPVDVAAPWALHMAGDWRAAADAWRTIGCRYEEAEALADGDEPAMRQALAIFEELGARPAADLLRARMREAGMTNIPARLRASTRAAPAHLTRRQLEVLALLTDGLTDREIADRLFITEKTAGHHVSAVLGKLDVRSRVEAAAAARKMGIAAL